MTGASSMVLLPYCLRLLWQRRSAALLALLLPLMAWVLPLLTPWQTQGALLQPTRMQTAWLLLWLALALFFILQAAAMGRDLRTQGLLEHVAASRHPLRQALLPVVLALGLWLNIALLLVLLLGWQLRPAMAVEAGLWGQLLLQQALLIELVALGLLSLATALATRFSQAVATLICLSLLACGWMLGSWLEQWTADNLPGMLSWLRLLLPRQDLADLNPRFIFKLGPLPTTTFLRVLGISGLQALALILISRKLCRCHTR